MAAIGNSFNRLVVTASIAAVLIVVIAVVALLVPGRTLAEPVQTGSSLSPTLSPSPPPPLDPPVQGPALNRYPAQSTSSLQLHRDIKAIEFDPPFRMHLGDSPQPPASPKPSADSGKAMAEEMIGPQQIDPLPNQESLLQSQGWTIQVYEDFEGEFGNGVGCWTVEDYGPDGLDRTWGKDDYWRAWDGNGSAWPANGGSDPLSPSGGQYSDNLASWMVCGPFDFSNAADIFVDFGMWLDTELYYDWLFFGASVDDYNYDGYRWSGSSNDEWLEQPFWLSSYAGYSNVWLAWSFTSDSSISDYEGVWVDDIAIWSYELPQLDDAGNLIQDGSFEEGGFGWTPITMSVQSALSVSDLSLDDIPGDNAAEADRGGAGVLAPTGSYVTNRSSVHGDWSAFMYADGELNDFLVQPITVPVDTTDIQFGFWFGVTTNEVNQSTDWFCASLADADLNELIVDLGCMDASYTTGYWQEVLYTFTDPEVAQAIEGGGVWLIFELYNRGATGTGTAAWIDYVRLYATGGDAGAYIDNNEPNDDYIEATAMSCGETVYGTIGDVLGGYGDMDWFRLDSVASGRIDVDISAQALSPPSALDSVVYLFDSADPTTPLVWNDDDGVTYDSYVTYTNPIPGSTFYVAVESYSGYGGPESFYTMTVECAGGGSGPPPRTETPTGAADTWTVMLYLNAEDGSFAPTLQQYINDMEAVIGGKTDFMTVTVLYDGPSSGDTVRYTLNPGGVYTNGINLWPLSEQNMGDPDTLSAFAGWSMDTYPAENYYLAIDDHGHGVYGISWDQTNSDDSITPPELYSALKDATNNGERKISIFDYEACLMGMAENAYDVREWVDYVVFFEQISWGLDTYPQYFSDLASTDTPLTVGTRIINRYHTEADNEGYPHTISLVDTSLMPNVKQYVTNLGNALMATGNVTNVTSARNRSQAFAADNDATNPAYADYIDLWDLANETTSLPGVSTAAGQVKTAVGTAVVAEQKSSGSVGDFYWDHSGAHGLSIYYPAHNASGAFNDYIAPRLFKMSTDESGIDGRWDEFLEWAVTTSGNGAGNGLGGGDRKGMNSHRFLQPKLGASWNVYLPLVMRHYPPIPDTPVLNAINNSDGDGNYNVSWNVADLANAYTLQEDDNASFSSPTTAYSGAGTSTSITSKSAGTYYYRVRASNSWGNSGWSTVRSVNVQPQWITVLSENFEGNFPGNTWTVRDNDPNSGYYYWGKRNCKNNGGSYSAWSVGAGDSTLGCSSNYPNDVYAWMIYGPFSLANATAAELTFDWWSDTEYDYDMFFWGASINGENYYGTQVTGNYSSWTTGEKLDLSAVPTLGNLMGENQVWIAFVFGSDSTVTDKGSFVDDILLRKFVGGRVIQSQSLPFPQWSPQPDQTREFVKLRFNQMDVEPLLEESH